MARKTNKTEGAPEAFGSPINANEAYPLDEFMRRSGLGKAAMRSLRLKGLPVPRIGNQRFVLGADFIRFVGELGKAHDVI